jgi:protein TonB
VTAIDRSFSRELALWVGSAVLVIAAHGGLAAALTTWSDAEDPRGSASAILIELAPLASDAAAPQANLPLGPQQDEQIEPEPKPEPDKVEPEVEQKVVDQPKIPDPPPPANAEVTLPREEPKQEQKPPPKKVVVATAPDRAERIAPRQKAATVGVASINPSAVLQTYGATIIRPHLLRYYSYPASARSKREEGVVVVSFRITRQGRLLSHSISKSSGHAELDNEALATLHRAEPFPPPPPGLTDQQLDFTLPMRYNIR